MCNDSVTYEDVKTALANDSEWDERAFAAAVNNSLDPRI